MNLRHRLPRMTNLASRARGVPSLFRAAFEGLESRLLLTRLAVVGDYSADVQNQPIADVANLVKSWNPDIVATVGDNNYPDGAASTIDANIGQYYHSFMAPYSGKYGAGAADGVNRFFPALGNHDYNATAGYRPYTDYFALPGNERYYTVTQGNIQLFIVNSDPNEPDGTTPNSVQGQWLKNGLAASSAPWKLVLFHHPPYTSGSHSDSPNMQWPFQQWGATAVLSGHDHDYERVVNKNGFPYFVDGLGGESAEGFFTLTAGSQVRYNGDYGGMLIDSTDSSIDFKFINRAGNVIDDYIINAAPAPTTLIPAGTTWKYLDTGTDQGTGWRATSFNDSTWKNGAAQFGYGDGDESTVVSYGSRSTARYPTTYFRKSFNVADVSAISSLTLGLLRDDGAVVYLNGTEVYRSNMPTSAIAYSTFASSVSEDNVFYSAGISPALLVNGVNTIAVEVHQSDASSNDLSFDFQLKAAPVGQPPPAPAGLLAAAVSASRVNLTWVDASMNETGFVIERKTGAAGVWETLATTAANVTTYSDLAAAAAATSFYRVRAAGGAGQSVSSNEAWATTLAAGEGVYLSDLNWTSATNGWGPVEKDRSNGSSGAGDGTTITLNGVTYIKGLGVHAIADVVYNLAGAYASFVADVGVDDEDGPGTVVFQVYADNVKTYDSGTMTQTAATKSINVSVANVQQLRLHVDNGGDNIDYDHADWANARLITPTPPAVPAGLSATAVSGTRIDLIWSDVAGETAYRIERSSDNVTFAQIGTTAANALSYSDTTASGSAPLYYRVRSANTFGASEPSNVASATPIQPPGAPGDLAATAVSDHQVDLTWSDGVGETAYRIERAFDGVTFAPIGTAAANALTYSDKTATGGATWSYRVIATNAGGESAPSNIAAAITPPAPPTNLVATAVSSTQIDLSWGDVTGELGYSLQRKTADTDWGDLGVTNADATGYSDLTAAADMVYSYRVRATGVTGDSADSNVAAISTAPPAAPSVLAAVPGASGTRIDLTWTDNSNNETGFSLERSPDGQTWTEIAAPARDATSYADSFQITPGASYLYRLRANSVLGSSSYSDVASATTPTAPAAPTNLAAAAAASGTRIDLTWIDGSDNETGFRIERSTDGTTWSPIATPAANAISYGDTSSVLPGRTYSYRLVAVNGVGTSDFSNTAMATTPVAPAAPATLTASVASNTQINLTWSDVAAETGYQIERSANGTTGWTLVASPGANITSFSNFGLTAGTIYYYRVRAINLVGPGGYSAVASATTTAPASTTTDLITLGDSWKYLDNGTNAGTAWRGRTFADTNWSTGKAQLGYGDGDEATIVSFGGNARKKYVTTYFRKSFTVIDPASITALSLSLMRDDGAVVYLNDTEVFRTNMPTGTINYTTLASSPVDANESALYTASINRALLVSGTNVIAVEIHQYDKTNADISFDLKLTANTTAATTATITTAFTTTLAATSIAAPAGSTPPTLKRDLWSDIEVPT